MRCLLPLFAVVAAVACGDNIHPGDTGSTDAGDRGGTDASRIAGSGLAVITEPGDGFTQIYDLISSAGTSVDMTMYELTDTQVIGLLTSAAQSGRKVRVILDQNLEMSSNLSAYQALDAGGVAVHWANPNYAATHQKSITVDGVTSAIMTLNLTPDDYKRTRDFAVITSDAADVAAIETTFAADFTNAAVTPPTGDDLVWSPTNASAEIFALINGAQTSLVVENEEMSDLSVVSALGAAAQRGVAVEVIMSGSSDYATEFATLEAAGVKVVTYAEHAPLYIHAKVILVDGATVFVGSENFSTASLTANRELGLTTTDSAIVSSIAATLASDYQGGSAYGSADGSAD